MTNISKSVSLIIPAYNEADVINNTIKTSVDYLSKICDSFEIIVSDNASTDNTAQIVKHQAEENERVRYVYEPNPGRGIAVETGFKAAQGEILCFIDADLSTNMDHLSELLKPIDNDNADLTTGSRWVPGEKSDRPLDRTIMSRTFNSLVRTFLRSSLYDHQCGFKAIKSAVFDQINDLIKADHWFWDTELLVIAQHHSYRVKEFPVKWIPTEDSSVDPFADVPMMAKQLFELTVRIHNGSKEESSI